MDQRWPSAAAVVTGALLVALPSPALAAADVAHLDGAQLSALWAIPFVGLLLSIAIFPLAAPFVWHHHYGKERGRAVQVAGEIDPARNREQREQQDEERHVLEHRGVEDGGEGDGQPVGERAGNEEGEGPGGGDPTQGSSASAR